MRPFLRNAADALAGAVKHRVTMTGIIVDELRARGDKNQAKIDALKDLVKRYEERPDQRTADVLAKAVCRLIKAGVLDMRGQPGDEYLVYVKERMPDAMDSVGAFEELVYRDERIKRP